ncbi:MAG: phosphopentomutase, partial [Clostridia bacterium]|nr:phosphopentomutase [Clostridia bacterium]
GRVIARPFTGKPGAFVRTPRRKDFSLEPMGPTLLDAVKAKGLDCLGVGKIEDIFCYRGLTGSNHAAGNPACIEATLDYLQKGFNGLLFVNLVDFDMAYGHRNDPQGYADALEYFDQKLPEIQSYLGEEDLLIVTADHGCDPTFPGTDHTREHIPILCWQKGMNKLVDLGTRTTYADIAATVAELLGLEERFGAKSFYQMMN